MTQPLDEVVIIALGSNLAGAYPNSETLLWAALTRFGPKGLAVTARSSWWRSAAWPDPANPAFLNGVALMDTDLSPYAVMAILAQIEGEFGRSRSAANAPRTLDLDLIAHGRTVLETPELVLPHPRAHERRFVMGPLAEIAPAWRHPVSGLTAVELATRAGIGADAAPIGHAALRKGEQNAI
jgi:2-amino-4-hydroxy-6-hydroxymethyldihydropteridine diphosphokinase